MRRRTTIALTTVLSMPMVLLVPTASMATGGEIDQIADVIEVASPGSESVVQPDASQGDALTFTGADTTVEVPLDADRPVVLTASGGQALEISLPEEVLVHDGVVASDGTVVYADRGADAHAAVQALDDGGVRLQTVLEGPGAPSTYTYSFADGVFPAILEDGSVELLSDLDDNVRASVGVLDAPWAVDAAGNAVPTWYAVAGNTLVQHVSHDANSAYPITADPKGTIAWWNTTLYFNRNETKIYAAGSGSLGTLVSWFPSVPTAVLGKVLQVHAGAFGIYYASGKCGKFVMYGHGSAPVPQPYAGAEAGGYCK